MAVLNEVAKFYQQRPTGFWALGDVVTVPTAILCKKGERPITAPPSSSGSELPTVSCDLLSGSGEVHVRAMELALTPALIVIDDCVIDKQFNEYITRCMNEGKSVDEATMEARGLPSLDPFVLVVPILPYAELRFLKDRGIRDGQTIGYFPILGSDVIDEGYVDFVRMTCLSRALLQHRLGRLSDQAGRILRWKLAQFHSLRNQSVDAEIESAIGKTITNVALTEQSKPTSLMVSIELNDGEQTLVLKQDPRRQELPAGADRGDIPLAAQRP